MHRARSESRPHRSRKIERNRADSRVRALRRVQQPEEELPRTPHARTHAGGREGERNPFQKLRHTRESEREGARRRELRRRRLLQRTQDDRADGRTNSLREEEKAAATTVPPLSPLFHDEEDQRRIEFSVIWSGEEAKRVGKDGVIVKWCGRGLRRCGERKLRDDDGAVVR